MKFRRKFEIMRRGRIPVVPREKQRVIKSRIKGQFEGWDGDTIVELDNGQIWKQTQWRYRYRYKYRPKVLLYRDGYRWYMQVEGMDAVGVERIR